MTVGLGLWSRWSLRDLRRHWLLIVAIALVLAIAVGMFAALGSTATWRHESNDASFDAAAFHDLRVELPAGETVERGELVAAIADLADPAVVTAAAERLLGPTQVHVAGADGPVLVRGEIIGVDVDDGPAQVDRLHVTDGLHPAESGVAVVETRFAEEYGLDLSGTIDVAGGRTVEYGGFGVAPEEFLVQRDVAGVLGHRSWAVLYVPLDDAGRALGTPGRVNDLVVRLAPGADTEAVASGLTGAVESATGLGVEVGDRRASLAYRTLYDDIDNDQQLWNVMAVLILGCAGFAVFNLVSRVVEAQRREMGVAMALGVGRARLAIRPLMIGVQVGVVGVVVGICVGLVIGEAIQSLLTRSVPLPEWRFELQLAEYVRASILGLLIPMVAAVVPVWRAVRVEPVAAMATVHAKVHSGLLGRVGAGLRPPGRGLERMAIRNLLRTPRRAVFTALAVGATITALFAVLGTLDSLLTTLDRAEEESLQGHPDRVDVSLEGFVAPDDPLVGRVASTEGVVAASTALQMPGVASVDDTDGVQLLIRLMDLDDAPWTPTVGDSVAGDAGIVLSDEAAEDLGVDVGDVVTLQHPVLGRGVGIATDTVVVSGRHPDPIRAHAYMDLSQAVMFGAANLRNLVMVVPDGESAVDGIGRELFDVEGVVATSSVREGVDAVGDAIGDFTGLLRIMEVGVLVIALLIAYNTTLIAAEERAREHATMLAFGVGVRAVTWTMAIESAIIGLVGTLLGLGVGYGVLRWIVEVRMDSTFPEFGILVDVAPTTIAVSLVIGVVVVAAAPLLAIRRLRRMEIAGALRVME